jgi:hypothetical protein
VSDLLKLIHRLLNLDQIHRLHNFTHSLGDLSQATAINLKESASISISKTNIPLCAMNRNLIQNLPH